jgi:hypothetical protein
MLYDKHLSVNRNGPDFSENGYLARANISATVDSGNGCQAARNEEPLVTRPVADTLPCGTAEVPSRMMRRGRLFAHVGRGVPLRWRIPNQTIKSRRGAGEDVDVRVESELNSPHGRRDERLQAIAPSISRVAIISGDRIDDPLLRVRETMVSGGFIRSRRGIIRARRCVSSLGVSSLGEEQRHECHKGRERLHDGWHLHRKSPRSCWCLLAARR